MPPIVQNILSYFQHLEQQSYLIIAAVLVTTLLAIRIVTRRQLDKKRLGASASGALFVPQKGFARSLKNLFVGSDRRIEDIIPELEEVLLTADVGVKATEFLVNKVLSQKQAQSHEEVFSYLKSEITQVLTPKDEFQIDASKKPTVIYLVGVNGVGKTTTIGKMASQYKAQGLNVMLVAADTFRAAAVEQLRVWSERNEVSFVGGEAEADPSSVIVDGLRSAQSKGMDVVLVDTAGRLQTKSNLMNELKKMVRMCEKELGRDPDEIFLVVDAITGQNGFSQAQIFLEATPLTGVVLTKYDATSKGGIIISIVQQTGLPIRYLGMGEGIADLKKFEAGEFVDRLFE